MQMYRKDNKITAGNTADKPVHNLNTYNPQEVTSSKRVDILWHSQ